MSLPEPLEAASPVFELEHYSFLDSIAFSFPAYVYEFTSSINPSLVEVFMFLTLATGCILLGAHSSISKPRNAALPNTDKSSPYYDVTDNDESKYIITSYDSLQLRLAQIDKIKLQHVIAMPIFSAAALYGIWYANRYVSASQINYWLNVNALVTGTFSVYRNSDVMLTRLVRRYTKYFGKDSSFVFGRYRIAFSNDVETPLGALSYIDTEKLLHEHKKDKSWIPKLVKYLDDEGISVLEPPQIAPTEYSGYVFDLKPLLLLPFSVAASYLFYQHNPVLNSAYPEPATNWLIHNFISANIATYVIGLLQFPKFSLSYVLLAGLFIYDAFFVFKTGVMMEVAHTVTAPIKILIPQNPSESGGAMSLLGLGDIVIPGTLASLCLRYDLFRYHEQEIRAFHHLAPYPRPYFKAAIASYVVGLATTAAVLKLAGKGQPALVYIVPSMIIGITSVAWLRGEIFQLFSYDSGVKDFDEDKYVNVEDVETSDSEYSDSGDDSLDDWIDKVEEKYISEEDATDIDEIAKQGPKPVVYVFSDESEEDEDDDTYLIGDSDDEEEEEDFEEEVAFATETEDLTQLKNDMKKEVWEFYEKLD